MSYQPEERYWTDYLRIAFPVLGLLLLLGLFWYWAMALIDNNGGSANKPTTMAGVVQPTATATATTAPGDLRNPPQSTVGPTVSSEAASQSAENATGPKPTRTPRNTVADTPTPTAVGKFKKGDTVVTNSEANLRSDPSMGNNVVTTLPVGTELRVTDASVQADNHIWVPVQDANGNSGYVAEELLGTP